MGFFKKLLFGMHLQRKVQKCDRHNLNVLQAFHVCRQLTIPVAGLTCSPQATLAFDERFLHCAERVEVRISPVSIMVVN
jgi:hypothetical protein